MPNWCDTTYRITCNPDTRKAILDAYRSVEKVNEIENKKYDKEYQKLKEQGLPDTDIYTALSSKGLFHHFNVWLYHILLNLGYSKKFFEDYHDNIRGYITDFDDSDPDMLTIRCDTAWGEAYGFRHLLEDKFHDDESLNILFTAEEPGMGEYYTNDPDYDDTYIVDIEWGSYDYETAESVIKIVNNRLNLQCKTVKEAIDAAEKHNETTENEDHIWIHEFEYNSEY